ncbi:histidine triad (HIT) family protein [Kribbella aluminosa]|uniref:Histidine triad (HIT) family protein n=1 Tax=Kribbella aluminosa TaxID=416017 RepID=A0ABS4V0H9_9ACTN|nr:HIT family protein [Kribbella aluminosa]MBP2357402.1 histidine triad (HIT) family protein [Kribbella aluminosa]
MADCLFCSIIAGTTPAQLVLDTADVVGFLDIRPVFKGHTLIVPRAHVPTMVEMSDEVMVPLFGAARSVAAAVRTAFDAQGSFVAVNNVVSQSVPHLHVHVVPRTKGDGLRGFFWPRTKYADTAEAEEYAGKLRAALGD